MCWGGLLRINGLRGRGSWGWMGIGRGERMRKQIFKAGGWFSSVASLVNCWAYVP